MRSESDDKRGGKGECSFVLWTLVLLQLIVVAFASDEQVMQVAASFSCFEIENGVLKDEAIPIEAASSCHLPRSLKQMLFTVQHVAQLVMNKQKITTKSCFAKNETFVLEYRYKQKEDTYTMINLTKFISSVCKVMKQTSTCIGKSDSVMNTYELLPIDIIYNQCGLKVNITKNYGECNNYQITHELCTAQRKNANGSLGKQNCGLIQPTYTHKIEVLYHNPSGQLIRRVAVQESEALEKNDVASMKPEFCDLILFEALKLIPEYDQAELRFVVLLRLFASIGSTTMEAATKAVRVVRDQHELHVVYCNGQNVALNPLSFYYSNVTNFYVNSMYLNLKDESLLNIYDNTSDFWKAKEILDESAANYDEYMKFDKRVNAVLVGNKSNWQETPCKSLNYIKTSRLSDVVLVLRFHVTTLLKNVSRNWTVSVILANKQHISSPDKIISCEQPYGHDKLEQMQIDTTEEYYGNFSKHNHYTYLYNFTYKLSGGGPMTPKKTWKHFGSQYHMVKKPVQFQKKPVVRVNGPNFQWFAHFNYNWNAFCNNSLMSFAELMDNTTSVTFNITVKIYRVENNSKQIIISYPSFIFTRKVVRAFIADYIYNVVDCDKRFHLSYWLDGFVFRSVKLQVTNLVTANLLICGNTSSGHEMCNELDTWSNYPILPSRSVNLTTVVHRLCKTLEHHYEVELTSQEKYKKSIGVELEYEARRLCSGEQRNCSEESVKVQLKLKVREHNPWVFRQLSCLDRNQSVNFNMRESFAQRKPTNNRKFSLNTTLIHIRLCRMANSSIIDRTFEAFSQYFAEDCFSPLKNLDTKLQLLNVSIDGSKLTVSFDKEKLCNSVEESFWKEDTQSVATLFVELAFRRNAGSSNLEQVLLLAVYKSVIPKSTRSIVVTSSFPAMRAELATTTSTKSIRRTFPTSSSTRHAEITTSTKSTTEPVPTSSSTRRAEITTSKSTTEPVPTSSSTRRAETTTSTETTTTTKAVLISSPSTGTKLTTSSESYISTRIKDSAARHDEITTKSVFSSLTASVETEPTRSIVSLLPNDYLAYPENAFDDKVTEKEPHWIEQDTESEVLDSRDTILLGQVPENKKKVEVGSTPDGRTEQWAVLSICAIAVVVFLVLFGAAHYVYSLLAWEREPNDKETYSGQLLDETVPIYVDPAYLRMETIDVNAVVDQAIKTYEIRNYYAPQASENVVMLDPQFSGERIRKKDASLRSQRHVSFLADYSKKQHSTTKNKCKTGAVHPN